MADSDKKITISWEELGLPNTKAEAPKPEKIVLCDLGATPKMDTPAPTGQVGSPTSTSLPPTPVSSPYARHRTLMIAVGTALVAAVTVGILFARWGKPNRTQVKERPEQTQAKEKLGQTPAKGSPDWIQAIGRSEGQSVVKLRTDQMEGTGFVVAAKGNRRLILTNRHVLTIKQGFIFKTETIAPQCRVILSTQEEFTGYQVGVFSDPDIDMALVAVECPKIHPLKVRPFDDVSVGEPVVAVGHPLGLDFTVTNGIVSAKRNPYVQHNAAINHGNSGGPLYDQHAQVIGVNTIGIEDSQGLFFSLRADLILNPRLWTIDPNIKDLMSQVNR